MDIRWSTRARVDREVCSDGLRTTVFPQARAGATFRSLADAWAVLPYENEIVTIEISYDDLFAIAQDLSSGHEKRSLMGVQVVSSGTGSTFRIEELRSGDGHDEISLQVGAERLGREAELAGIDEDLDLPRKAALERHGAGESGVSRQGAR